MSLLGNIRHTKGSANTVWKVRDLSSNRGQVGGSWRAWGAGRAQEPGTGQSPAHTWASVRVSAHPYMGSNRAQLPCWRGLCSNSRTVLRPRSGREFSLCGSRTELSAGSQALRLLCATTTGPSAIAIPAEWESPGGLWSRVCVKLCRTLVSGWCRSGLPPLQAPMGWLLVPAGASTLTGSPRPCS